MLHGLTYQYSQLWILEMHTPLIPQCTLCTHNTKYESLRISTETLWFYSLDTSFIDLGIKFPISYLVFQSYSVFRLWCLSGLSSTLNRLPTLRHAQNHIYHIRKQYMVRIFWLQQPVQKYLETFSFLSVVSYHYK